MMRVVRFPVKICETIDFENFRDSSACVVAGRAAP
jgi:hypothetical protein